MDLEAHTRAALARIAEFNPAYRAFSHLASDALAQAATLQAKVESGGRRGPLHGVTVSVKGNIPISGLPWTEGSGIYADRVARRDAAIVERARAADAIILGATTLSELAMYGVTNPFEAMGLNPWDVARTAGGSSTGAGVAAALGLAQINIGTDSGGSIRNPACHCGVVGFMPRIGALTLEGKPNHTPSLSSIGLVARAVDDVAQAYGVLADSAPPAPEPACRLLVLRGLIEQTCDEETQGLFSTALAKTGFDLVDAEIPGWVEGERAAGVLSLYQSGQTLARMDLSRASEGIRARAAAAAKLSSKDVAQARAACATLRRNVSQALRSIGADAVATPTWPFPAPGIQEQTVRVQGKSVPIDPHRNCFVRAANAMDACAITLPMGLYGCGVPAGLHLTANGGDEGRLLAVAGLVEAALPPLPLAPPLRQLGEFAPA